MKTNQLTKRQQIRNSLIYMLPVGLGSLIPFITIPIFTRILTPEDYGILALALIYAIFMCGLANFGVSLVFERNYFQYRDNPEKLAQLLYSSLVFIMTNFALLAGITYLFKENISEFLTGSDQYDILIMTAFAANFFSGTANNLFFAYFKNAEKATIYTKYKILSTVLYFIISLILVAYMRVGVIGIVMAQLITGVSTFLLFMYSLLKELPFSLNKNILFKTVKISYPLIPGAFNKIIHTEFDKYMISLMVTLNSVGVYYIGKKISELSFTFMTAVENVFNPQVYQRLFGQHDQGSESIGKYLTPFLYVAIFVALLIALFSEELMTILTPTSYHAAIPIITILSMYFGFFFFAKINSVQLIYMKKSHIVTVLGFVTIGLNVGLNIPFIMMFGAVGAAWGTMLAGLISGTIKLLVAQHYYKINYERNKIAWIMGTFFIGATVIAFMNLLDIPYFWSLTVKIIFLAFYLNLGIYYKIITKENYREIGSIFRPLKTVTT